MSSPRPFTPTYESPDALDRRTVANADVINRIAHRIDAAVTSGNIAHTLVFGPRGSGKTHTLAVAIHRTTAGGAVVASVPEDHFGIVTYRDLLNEIASQLGAAADASMTITDLEASLIAAAGDRLIVLTIENLAGLFDSITVEGQRLLRSWVERTRRIIVIGTNPILFTAAGNRDHPWFGSFAFEHLESLTAAQGGQLLGQLRADDAELVEFLRTPTGLARVAALHHLTGGSPRLWTLVASVVRIDTLDALVPAVEDTLEGLVSYYQHRLADLAPSEQRIVVALARRGIAATATQLAEELSIGQQVAANTLRDLAEQRWVRGRKIAGTDQRATWYELTEPLLRHYQQYRTSRSGTELGMVVEILRAWYDQTTHAQHVAGALEMYRAVAADRERVLGADHRDTLSSRSQLAHYTGESGDVAGALEMWADLRGQVRDLRFADASIGQAVERLAVWAAVRLIAEHRPEEVPESMRTGTLGLLVEAAMGSVAARERLPSELRDILPA